MQILRNKIIKPIIKAKYKKDIKILSKRLPAARMAHKNRSNMNKNLLIWILMISDGPIIRIMIKFYIFLAGGLILS